MDYDTLLDAAADDAVRCLGVSVPRPSGLDVLSAYGMEDALNGRLESLYSKLACRSLGRLDLSTYKRLALAGPTTQKPLTRELITHLGRLGALYPNRDIWVLYWATLVAQHRLSLLFCGSGSHEERLTGHLASELVAARDQLMRALRRLSWLWSGPSGDRSVVGEIVSNRVNDIRAEIAYADIACARQEALTGGDLALVLVRPRSPQYIPIRLQAKKAGINGTASIAANRKAPRSQLDHLLASGIGHYLYFYPVRGDLGPLTPIVQSAEDAERSMSRSLRARTDRGGVDLATFVLEVLVADRGIQGEESMRSAIERVMSAGDRRPGMVLAMSGAPSLAADVFSQLEEAVAPYRDVLVEPDDSELEFEEDAPEDKRFD